MYNVCIIYIYVLTLLKVNRVSAATPAYLYIWKTVSILNRTC